LCQGISQSYLSPAGGNSLPVLNEQSLAGDQNWQRSRFGELEAFMVDFLVGGASAGESLRLKLQTPLFVSDALLEAARQQLEAELLAAKQVRMLDSQIPYMKKSTLQCSCFSFQRDTKRQKLKRETVAVSVIIKAFQSLLTMLLGARLLGHVPYTCLSPQKDDVALPSGREETLKVASRCHRALWCT